MFGVSNQKEMSKIDRNVIVEYTENQVQQIFKNKNILTNETENIFINLIVNSCIEAFCSYYKVIDDRIYHQIETIIYIALNLMFKIKIFLEKDSKIFYEKFFLNLQNKKSTTSMIYDYIKNYEMLKNFIPDDCWNYASIIYHIWRELISNKKQCTFLIGVDDLNISGQKFDMASVDTATRNYVRYLILLTIKKNPGLSNIKIAALISVDRKTVGKVKRQYVKDPTITFMDLMEKRRGPEPKPFNKIPAEVFAEFVQVLADKKTPGDFNLQYSSWSAKCIVEYLNEVHNISVSLDYVYHFLKKFEINSKACSRLNPSRNLEKMAEFLKSEYPKLCQEAKENGEVLIFGDETSCMKGERNYGYSVKGQRSILSFSTQSRHTGASIFTVMGVDGFCEFFMLENSFNAISFLECLLRLHKEHPNDKFLLILDNCKVHHAVIVETILDVLQDANQSFLRIKWLPAYCPELNPVEYFNNYYKNFLKHLPLYNKKDILAVTDNFLENLLQKEESELKNLIVSFFKAPGCMYSYDTYRRIFDEENNGEVKAS